MLRLELIGNLCRDPETRTVGNSTVTSVTVAAPHGFGDKKTTTFVRVQVWGKQGDALARFAHQGDKIYVAGTADLREWEGNDGVKHKDLELNGDVIEFLGGKSDSGNSSQPRQQKPKAEPKKPVEDAYTEVNDDDLPF